MTDTLDPLVLDLLEWIDRAPRTYTEVMEAWRTSCPRLTVWEDAVDRGFVGRKLARGQCALVELTPAGRVFLSRNGRSVLAMAPVVGQSLTTPRKAKPAAPARSVHLD